MLFLALGFANDVFFFVYYKPRQHSARSGIVPPSSDAATKYSGNEAVPDQIAGSEVPSLVGIDEAVSPKSDSEISSRTRNARSKASLIFPNRIIASSDVRQLPTVTLK